MKIIISGASGFIGHELSSFLEKCGHQIVRLVRDPALISDKAFFFDPSIGEIDTAAFEGVDAVINLLGENIASSRWNEKKKKQILQSRIQSTDAIAKAIVKLKTPPGIYIGASAVGLYGERGDTFCSEEMPSGDGFLASVCKGWEKAADPLIKAGVRVTFLRIGVVLSPKGGALNKMLPAFRLGLGGPLGNGNQYMSWIALDDLIAIILFTLITPAIHGPLNAVSPHPVTNKEFTKVLGKVLGRCTVLKLSAFLLKLLFGKEMAEELFLTSTRAIPTKLTDEGYSFLYPDLQKALSSMLLK